MVTNSCMLNENKNIGSLSWGPLAKIPFASHFAWFTNIRYNNILIEWIKQSLQVIH